MKRFGKITCHPNLDPSGLYSVRPKACDPCYYYPQSIDKAFEVNKYFKKESWKSKQELEDWSKNLGYRNQTILNNRNWFKSILGPAWHEVKLPRGYEPACNNLSFGRVPRFKKSTTSMSVPAPGSYYKPSPFKISHGPHSIRPTFEREGPCRMKDTVKPWSLAPNRYIIIDKESIEEVSKKVVSLRGPYDVFTGKRDGSTIKNHFNKSSKCSAATWPSYLPESYEKFKKTHLGRFNKTPREVPCRGRNALVDITMCMKSPDEPGPADTIVDKQKIFKQNKCGFNSSYDRPPGYQRVIVWPGVGRYNTVTDSDRISGHGHRHVFLSKQGRTIGAILPQPMNSF